MKRTKATLVVTALGYCPINCERYCPQDVYREAYGRPSDKMSYYNFQKYLENVPQQVRICFSGFSEPFLNPECVQMVRWAYQKGHTISVYTTLAGLTPDDVIDLKEIPFEIFCVHLPDTEGNMSVEITPEYKDTLISTIVSIPNITFTSMNGSFITNEREDVCRGRFKIKHYPVRCMKHAGNEHVLLPDGRVVLCSMDFGVQHVVGNLLVDKYEDIEKTDEMRKIKRSNRSFTNSYSLCKKCKIGKDYLYYMFYNTLSWGYNKIRKKIDLEVP